MGEDEKACADSQERADEHWMQCALNQAEQAEQAGEVPVGAILVKDGICIARGWNQPIRTNDPSAHAEMLALRAGGIALGNYRLLDTTLYVTLEPCVMCMGAIIHARVKRLVFGATDPKRGAVVSALRLADAEFLNHTLASSGGILADECAARLHRFFRSRR